MSRELGLELRLPVVVSHAIDDLPRLFLAQRNALCGGSLLIPVGEAIPAKAGKRHEIDILHLDPLAQMLDEATEGGCFELDLRLLIHDRRSFPAKSWGEACATGPVGE